MWYRIELPYGVFGLREENGIVVESAPMGKWSIGKNIEFVLDYYRTKKKAKVMELG